MQVHGHRHGHYPLPQLDNLRQRIADRFTTADADADGSLTLAEFQAMGKTLPAGNGDTPAKVSASDAVAKFDANADGTLDVDEVGQLLAARGSRWCDGLHTIQEAKDDAETVEAASAVEPTGEDAATDDAEPAIDATKASRRAELFQVFDTNDDETLSLEEFTALKLRQHLGMLFWLQHREAAQDSASGTDASDASVSSEAAASVTPAPTENTITVA